MRGQQERSVSLFSYVSIEDRIPANHPLRRIRKLADQALDRLNPSFCRLYASEGRPSVPPEQLLLASLLQAFYGIPSERLLLDQLHDNLLFHWFVGQRKISLAVLAGWLPTHLEIRLYDTLPSFSCTALAPRCWRRPSCMGPWRSTPPSWSSTCAPAIIQLPRQCGWLGTSIGTSNIPESGCKTNDQWQIGRISRDANSRRSWHEYKPQ